MPSATAPGNEAMTQNYTPGPWEVRERETVIRTGDMYAADGFTSYVDGIDVWGPDDRPIIGPNGIPALETDGANARLIAAAPDLLEALKDARYALYGSGPGNPKIDAAIAKAEGKP